MHGILGGLQVLLHDAKLQVGGIGQGTGSGGLPEDGQRGEGAVDLVRAKGIAQQGIGAVRQELRTGGGGHGMT